MPICILGRQPGLSAAELEAVLGPESIQSLGKSYALVKVEPTGLNLQELGGTVKVAEIIATIPSIQWGKIFSASVDEIVRYMTGMAERTGHKLELGLSAYDLHANPKQISTLAFTVKKRLNEKGHLVNVSLGKDDLALNSASVVHNGLLGKFGSEFLLVRGEKETYLARTLSVQDIESYSARDYGRPKRDTQVGMLPPKLAQMMLNLAKVTPDSTVLDPFCGTGVVLMEAALKHAKVMGSDIEQKMVDYTKENLNWLAKQYGVEIKVEQLSRADATTNRWGKHFDCVVSETYLGQPFAYQPKDEELKPVVNECNAIVTKFLTNLKPQLDAKSRCCIAVPAWTSPEGGLIHLPGVEQLERLGYQRVKFQHAGFDKLVYRRQDQFVARELLVLKLNPG